MGNKINRQNKQNNKIVEDAVPFSPNVENMEMGENTVDHAKYTKNTGLKGGCFKDYYCPDCAECANCCHWASCGLCCTPVYDNMEAYVDRGVIRIRYH
jgi:hypothetical protein